MESSNKPKLVRIHWLDTTSFLGWYSPELASKQKSMIAVAIGFLVEETDNDVVLSMMVAEDGDVNTLSVIPKVSIISMDIVEEVKWK